MFGNTVRMRDGDGKREGPSSPLWRFSSRSGGQIYLFPWKLRWNFTDYFAVMMRDISSHKFLLPFLRQWWTIFYLAFKDVTRYLYGSRVICNDIHFIVSYNPVKKIKSKTDYWGAWYSYSSGAIVINSKCQTHFLTSLQLKCLFLLSLFQDLKQLVIF